MQKSKIFIPVLLLGMFVLFNSCKKDDPEPSYFGQIKLENVSYNIANVVVQTITMGDETTSSISLVSASASKTITVQLSLSYPSSEGISGTYSVETVNGSVRYLDSWLTNYFIMEGANNMQSFNNLVSGTATISDKGDNKFDISFKFKPSAGSEIEGTYSGKVMKQSMGF